MTRTLLSRRQFNARCAAFGLSIPALDSMIAPQASAQIIGKGMSRSTARTVKFPDGTLVPALGQGCWHLGQGIHPLADEEEALRTGIALGMTVIDTSGNYGDGLSERFISHATAGQRDRIFARACEASLARLGTDHLDLYLLHSPVPSEQFSHVVSGFEQLRAAGKIRAWGVSNFELDQMEELLRVPDGHRCATNQVPYSLNDRGIEADILPWCKRHDIPVMAYSPLGGADKLIVRDPTLARIGAMHDCSGAAVALAWAIRSGNVIAIPESGSSAHVKENAVALSVALTPRDLQILNAAYPGPSGAT